MPATLQLMREHRANERKPLRLEFFRLSTKRNPTQKDIGRLSEVCDLLGYDAKLLDCIQTVLQHYEGLRSEIEGCTITDDQEQRLQAELDAITIEFQERAAAYDRKRDELANQLHWTYERRQHVRNMQSDLDTLRKQFGPLFGEASEFGNVTTSGGPLDGQLRMLRDAERLAVIG